MHSIHAAVHHICKLLHLGQVSVAIITVDLQFPCSMLYALTTSLQIADKQTMRLGNALAR